VFEKKKNLKKLKKYDKRPQGSIEEGETVITMLLSVYAKVTAMLQINFVVGL